MIFTDLAGTMVYGISGVSLSSDTFLSVHNAGTLAMPVLLSAAALLEASAAGTARFDMAQVVSLGSGSYALSQVYTGAAASNQSGVGPLTFSSGSLGMSMSGFAGHIEGGVLRGSASILGGLDVGDGSITVFAATGEVVRGQIGSAFNGGGWDGYGLTSTVARPDAGRRTGVGYAVRPDGSVFVRHTLYGDANLDGVVDGEDLLVLQQSLGSADTPASWSAGDFNYDNVINADDLILLDRNFGRAVEEVK